MSDTSLISYVSSGMSSCEIFANALSEAVIVTKKLIVNATSAITLPKMMLMC